MPRFGAPSLIELLIVGIVALLLLSGPFGTMRWVHAVGHRIVALQVHLGKPHARQILIVVILCSGLLLGLLALASFFRG